jgi:hypothetical protein
MKKPWALLPVLLLLAGCTIRHEAKPFSLPRFEGQNDRNGSVAVSSEALLSGPQRMKNGPAKLEIDPGQFAETLATAIAGSLRKSGLSVEAGAEEELRVIFDYAVLVPGSGIRCYVDVTVTTSSGMRRGFQGVGKHKRAEDACQQALKRCGMKILASRELRAFVAHRE